MDEKIMVSIVCVTYNHKKYIAKAIEGFINQVTTFAYEILIHDDASNDGTLEILKEYENKNIRNFHVFYEKENQHAKGRLDEAINRMVEENAQGKYIAICEGDDYWIDNKKLQIQIDYMEKNPECVMTGHNGLWVDDKTFEISAANGFVGERDLNHGDIIRHKRGCFPTASTIVKKENYILNEPFCNHSVGDWPRQLQAIENGRVHYFDRIMSVYNVNVSGSWTARMKENGKRKIIVGLEMIDLLNVLNMRWKGIYSDEIDNAKEGYIIDILNIFENIQGDKIDYMKSVCEETNHKYDVICQNILKRIDAIENQKKELCIYVKRHNYNFIMGCGKIAGELFEKMKVMNLDIDGFVVSNNQNAPIQYKGKKVWRWSELPYPIEKIGTIVGIQYAIKKEIEESLRENGIEDYVWPRF